MKGDVIVVGAGPVGLFLAARLAQLGIQPLVLERSTEPVKHSRAIGIHAPGLERLDDLGVAHRMVEAGRRVMLGRAFSSRHCLGTISFERLCPPPFNFVLTLQQYITERILEERLGQLAPGSLRRGLQIEHIDEDASGIRVTARSEARGAFTAQAQFLVGCDGKTSMVREKAGIRFEGKSYPNTFVMGDFEDDTGWGAEGRIYLCDDGLVESFPLPCSRRRWVVSTAQFEADPLPREFCRVVSDRTGYDPGASACEMLSPFGVQRYVASNWFKGRSVLAGDAAHVMPPFGGQGMNTGWLDAADLAGALNRILRKDASSEGELGEYERAGRQRAEKAIRRAELNMTLGSRVRWPRARNALVWFLLHSPAKPALARLFTMRGL